MEQPGIKIAHIGPVAEGKSNNRKCCYGNGLTYIAWLFKLGCCKQADVISSRDFTQRGRSKRELGAGTLRLKN